MNNFKILFICLLICSLLSSALISCSTNDNTISDNNTNVNINETNVTVKDMYANLKNLDFNGTQVNLLVRSEFVYEFRADTETGDLINDAVYKRNMETCERLNIKLNVTDVTGSFSTQKTFLDTIKNNVLAGDKSFDIVASAANYMLTIVPDGYFTDLNTVPNVDLKQPWYSQGYNENMAVNGALYYTTGSASINSLENMCVLFFNKKLMDNYGFESPYSLVKNGSWYFDNMYNMVKQVSGDLDGDGQISEKDLLGYITYNNMINAATVSFGLSYCKYNSDGIPILIDSLNDRMITAFEKMESFINDCDATMYCTATNDALVFAVNMQRMFSGGNILFMAQVLSSAQAMRSMDTDFGILPMPKLDEAQTEYYTNVMENVTVLGIPSVVNDLSCSGAVLEALSIAGYTDLSPAYYNIALKTKYSRDNDSEVMLDIIRDSARYDFIFMNTVTISGMTHLFSDAIIGKSSYASAFESQKTAAAAKLAALIDGYSALKDK